MHEGLLVRCLFDVPSLAACLLQQFSGLRLCAMAAKVARTLPLSGYDTAFVDAWKELGQTQEIAFRLFRGFAVDVRDPNALMRCGRFHRSSFWWLISEISIMMGSTPWTPSIATNCCMTTLIW